MAAGCKTGCPAGPGKRRMSEHPGLSAFLARPLAETIWRRRTHRVSRGSNVSARSMSYKSSNARKALTELEEAVLIAMTGCTGLTMPDRPFTDPRNDEPIMSKPNVHMEGRTAGSPDNAQGTHFFLINDTGTYYLRKLPPAEDGASVLDPDALLARASQAKVKLLDRRIDVPDGNRDFPAYLDSNRFLSNLPGTTIFFPVVDLSHQYINAIMYLLTQPDGARPTIVDDRNFYQPAGVKKWVKNGFLNKKIKLPLGNLGAMRTQIEADLLLQNLMLTADSMGLGAWIHASISPPVMLGVPKFTSRYGSMMGFDHVVPKWRLADGVRWGIPLPMAANIRANPVGLRRLGEPLIRCMCPPNYATMDDAVDEVVAGKFGPHGIYSDEALFHRIYNGEFGAKYLKEASAYAADVVACTRDI